MLTKRTHILFDEELWNRLILDAKRQQTSIGNIVRSAVRGKYEQEDILKRRKQAIATILKTRKRFKGIIDYKALINEGRRI